jgi:hypothetical protein
MPELIEILCHIKVLKQFIAPHQLNIIASGCRTEEKEFFFEKIKELSNTFNTMPVTYEQDGKGEKAIVYFHYFCGNMDWYIIEKDTGNSQTQAYGYCDLGTGLPELGYISLIELAHNSIEIDLHWTPTTLGEVKASRN